MTGQPDNQGANPGGGPKAVAPTAAQPNAPKAKKVLVVEDERVTQAIIGLILKGAGYTVLSAKDASTALTVLRTERPDLMTLDVDLSRDAAGEVWDGFRIVEWMQHHRPDEPVPFIIISAGNPAVVQKRAQSLRAFGCLSKPVQKETLLQMVRQAIGDAPPPAVPASPAPKSPPPKSA